MLATCPKPQQGRLQPILAALLATLVAAVAFAAAPQAAQAGPGVVELKSVFAKPIEVDRYPDVYPEGFPVGAATPGAPVPQAGEINETTRCTPEADGRLEYGTDGVWDPFAEDISWYGVRTGGLNEDEGPDPVMPGRMPSTAEMTPATQAGASHDLCFGFTLTPGMQPELAGLQRGANPELADVDATHVRWADGAPVDNDDVRTAEIRLPAGYAADLISGPAGTCSDGAFAKDLYVDVTCPSAQVGTVYLRAAYALNSTTFRNATLGGHPNVSSNPLETGQGRVFKLAAGPGELARLGISIKPVTQAGPTKLIVRMILDPDGSGRVRAITENIPRRLYLTSGADKDVCGVAPDAFPGCAGKQQGELREGAVGRPLYVEAVAIRAWGKKADHPTLASDFSEWDTSCTPKTATATVTTYEGTVSTKTSDPYTLEGCDQLDFDPSISIETTQRRAGVPTGAKVTVGLGQQTKVVGGETVKTAHLKDAVVQLPAGLELGAQVGSREGGLKLCTAEQFGRLSAAPAACDAGSKAGDVKIVTPLLGSDRPLTGSVYLGPQAGVGVLPDLYLEASIDGSTEADAARVKLVGEVTINKDNGQLTTSFRDNPQLRFSQLELTFPDGPTALFTTPRTCGTASGDASFTPWSGQPAVQRSASITIDQDCDAPGFQPAMAMTPSSAEAGAAAPTKITIARADRSPWLKDLKVNLPEGFLANLKLVAECPNEQAWAGTCGEPSRMGTVTTTAGAGEQPFSLTGAIYLTSWQPPAVANTTIVVRAKVGDLDLGTVVVPGQIYLHPTNGSLSMYTSVPQRFQGIALDVRQVDVDLDRPGFALNPSSCGPLGASVEAVSETGQFAVGSTQVAYANCGARPFAPVMNAVVSGESQVGGHPSVRIDINPRAGDSNLKAVSVLLPVGLAPDVKNVQTRCTGAQFAEGGCPAGAKAGTVMATVSITNDVIYGDVWLVDQPGETLPGIGFAFNGRYTQRVLSTVRYAGADRNRVQTTFPVIPDLPLTGMSLTLEGGPKGVLTRTKCSFQKTSWDATFVGQGGQTHNAVQPAECGDAPISSPKLRWSRKSGLSISLSDFGDRKLRSAKLYLPKGLTFDAKRAKRKNAVRGTMTGAKSKLKRKKSTLVVSTKTNNATKLSIKVKSSALKRSSKRIKKGKRYNVKLRLAFTDGTVEVKTVKVKAP